MGNSTVDNLITLNAEQEWTADELADSLRLMGVEPSDVLARVAHEGERRLSAALGLERERSEQLEIELAAARKVAEAAIDWADAQAAYSAGAGGSSAYLRAREQLLRAVVREYRNAAA